LYDPDVKRDKNKKKSLEELISSLKSQLDLAVVWLPEGRDPGSLDRQFMRDYVKSEAKKQNINVSWEKMPVTSRP